ncbi:MAG: hypothetical protein JO142_17105 [Burkholderiales bacterium]|nr:hypothetical protein [Burkholderiales bacterium]
MLGMTHSSSLKARARAAIVVLGLGFAALSAQAAIHVYSPIVEEGEAEIELKADHTFDKSNELNNGRSANVDIGYGVNSFWATEIEAQWKQDPMGTRHYDSTSWENRFQLTEQGEYWVDVGIFAEYEKVVQKDDHNNATVGLLLQKEFGDNVTTFNFLLNREFGTDGAPGLTVDYRLQSRWRLNRYFEPGFELYGAPGRLGHFESYENQRVRMGPVAVGIVPVSLPGKLKYEVGYLAGLSRGSERGTARALLEYESHF